VVLDSTLPPATDRRVRRSRAALMAAAVALVTEQGTADVPVAAIAEAADVSRRLLYQQFGDRETLLLEAALDLARRDLLPRLDQTSGTEAIGARTLAIAQHMATHRAVYRALLTSPCAFALTRALNRLFLPANRTNVREAYGESLDERTSEDLAAFLSGGWGDFIFTWVVEGPETLDAEEFAGRLARTRAALFARPSSTEAS
jgi:AcrR family transcriptional regulator